MFPEHPQCVGKKILFHKAFTKRIFPEITQLYVHHSISAHSLPTAETPYPTEKPLKAFCNPKIFIRSQFPNDI